MKLPRLQNKLQAMTPNSRWLLHKDERVLCAKGNKDLHDYLGKQHEATKTKEQIAEHGGKEAKT